MVPGSGLVWADEIVEPKRSLSAAPGCLQTSPRRHLQKSVGGESRSVLSWGAFSLSTPGEAWLTGTQGIGELQHYERGRRRPQHSHGERVTWNPSLASQGSSEPSGQGHSCRSHLNMGLSCKFISFRIQLSGRENGLLLLVSGASAIKDMGLSPNGERRGGLGSGFHTRRMALPPWGGNLILPVRHF